MLLRQTILISLFYIIFFLLLFLLCSLGIWSENRVSTNLIIFPIVRVGLFCAVSVWVWRVIFDGQNCYLLAEHSNEMAQQSTMTRTNKLQTTQFFFFVIGVWYGMLVWQSSRRLVCWHWQFTQRHGMTSGLQTLLTNFMFNGHEMITKMYD